MIALSRVVMTIREKFADLRFWKSKYKDSHMVLLFIGVSEATQRLSKYNRIDTLSKEGEIVVQ